MKHIFYIVIVLSVFSQGCTSPYQGVRETLDGKYYVVYMKKLIKKDDEVTVSRGDSLSLNSDDNIILVNQTPLPVKIDDFIFEPGESLNLSKSKNFWIMKKIKSGILRENGNNFYPIKLKKNLWIVKEYRK